MQQTDNVLPVKEQEKQDQTQVNPSALYHVELEIRMKLMCVTPLSIVGQRIRNTEPN